MKGQKILKKEWYVERFKMTDLNHSVLKNVNVYHQKYIPCALELKIKIKINFLSFGIYWL